MIEIKNINIIYDSQKIIKDSQIVIPSGILTGISGESGSGKTSLFYVIGLVSKLRGYEYCYNGNKIDLDDDYIKSQIRKNKIGFIFQDKNLHEYLSIEDNLKMYSYISGNEYDYEKAIDILKKVHLDLELTTLTKVLSGGEKQRLAIACALMKNPDLIIADEPTSAMDKENSQIVIDILKKIASEGKMVIIASHNQNILSQCDIQYHIEKQRISLKQGSIFQDECEKKNLKEIKIFKKFYMWYSRFEFGKGKWEKLITLFIPSFIISICVTSIFLKDNIIDHYSSSINDMGLNEVLVESKINDITRQGFELLKKIEGVSSVNYIYSDYINDMKLNDRIVSYDSIIILPYFDYQLKNMKMEKKYDGGNVYFSYSLAKKLNLKDFNEMTVNSHLLREQKYIVGGYFQRDYMLTQSKEKDIIYIPYEYFDSDKTSNTVLINVSHFRYLDKISDKISTINPTFTTTLSETKYLSQISFINLYEKNIVNFLIVLMSITILLLMFMNFFVIRNQKYEITVLKANGLSQKELMRLIVTMTIRSIIMSTILIMFMLIIKNFILVHMGYPSILTSINIISTMIIFVSFIYAIPQILTILYLNHFDAESLLRF